MAKQDGIVERVAMFMAKMEAYYVVSHAARGYLPFQGAFEAEYGVKQVRIVIRDQTSRSVYCFIDLSNGDILKAAGYKAPAKGKRGSIWNDDCDVGDGKPCDLHGSGLYRRTQIA